MGRSIDLLQLPRQGCPLHLRADLTQLWRLTRWANFTRALWGEPVYLCGSALKDENANPRDWDIRLMLPDGIFALKFGGHGCVDWWIEEFNNGMFTEMSWRWAVDMARTSRNGMHHTFLNIDFQCFPEMYWKKYNNHPRYQLDTFGMDLKYERTPDGP